MNLRYPEIFLKKGEECDIVGYPRLCPPRMEHYILTI